MLPKFQPILAETAAIVGGSFSAIVAAVAASTPNAAIVVKDGATTVIQPLVIMDNTQMRLVCVIGALAGGVLSSILFAGKEPTSRSLATKVFSSTLLGIIATPAVFHWMGWTPTTDTLLFASAFVALIGVGVVKTVVPLYEAFIVRKVSPPNP